MNICNVILVLLSRNGRWVRILLPQPKATWCVNQSLQQEELINVDEAAQIHYMKLGNVETETKQENLLTETVTRHEICSLASCYKKKWHFSHC